MAAVAHRPLVNDQHGHKPRRADRNPDWPPDDGDEEDEQHDGHTANHCHGYHREAAASLRILPAMISMLRHRAAS